MGQQLSTLVMNNYFPYKYITSRISQGFCIIPPSLSQLLFITSLFIHLHSNKYILHYSFYIERHQSRKYINDTRRVVLQQLISRLYPTSGCLKNILYSRYFDYRYFSLHSPFKFQRGRIFRGILTFSHNPQLLPLWTGVVVRSCMG